MFKGCLFMNAFFSRGFMVTMTIYAGIHFIEFFHPSERLEDFLSLMGMAALLFAFLHTRMRQMTLPLCLTLSAMAIMLITSSGSAFFHGLWEGLRQMRALVGLLFIVPIVSWVLRYEPYIEDVMIFFRKQLNGSKRFYGGVMAVIQIINYFVLIGTIPIMYQFVHTFLKGKKGEVWETYRTSAVMRGFALGTLWIISIPSFSYAIQSTGASLTLAILQGFLVTVAGIILALIFLHVQEKRGGLDLSAGIQEEIDRVLKDGSPHGLVKQKVIEFMILFVSLFGSILVIHLIFHWDLLVVIPLVVLGWTLIYFLIKGNLVRFLQESKYYVLRGIPLKAKEMSIFLSAGLLIYALNASGWGQIVVESIYQLTDGIPGFNFLWVLPLIVVMLGLMGLSPLTVMVLLGGIVQSIDLPYPPELILLSLTMGSVITILLSPLVIPVIIISNENGRTPWQNAFKSNWAYAIVFYFVVETYAQCMLWLGVLS